MKIYKMGLQNERIYEISSKSNSGKVVKYTGNIFWWGISQGGGNFGEKMKIYIIGLQNERIYEISSKSNNGKVVKYTGKIFWGGISQGWGGKFRGGILKKKMNTYKMGLQNKCIYKISSKSNKGKVVKYTGKIFWGKISQEGGKFGGANFEKRNENLQISFQK